MISHDDDLIGMDGAGQPGGDSPDRPHAIVQSHHQVGWGAARARTIRHRQAALPRGGRLGAPHGLEDHARVSPRERRAHDGGQRDRVRWRDPSGAGHRRPSRGQRIARHAEIVDDSAALNVALGPPRPVRIGLSFLEPIVSGIGINQDAGRTALFGGERLEPPIAVRHGVPHQRDLALDIDAVFGEPGVVLRIAAACIDDRGGDVARRGVRVIRGPDVVRRKRIAGDGIFPERRVPRFHPPARAGAGHLDAHVDRVGQEDAMLDDFDLLESVLAPAVADPVGQHAIARRPRDMRLGGQDGVGGTRLFRGRQQQETVLDRMFSSGRPGGETVNRPGRLFCSRPGTKDTNGTKDTKEQTSSHHPFSSQFAASFSNESTVHTCLISRKACRGPPEGGHYRRRASQRNSNRHR